MSEKRKMTIDSLITVGSAYYLQAIGIVVGLINSRILGPVNVGLMSGLQVIIFWSSFTHLGILSAAQREIPFFLAKGDEGKVRLIKGISALTSIIPAILISCGIAMYALLNKSTMEPKIFWGVLTSAFWLFLTMYHAYILTVPIRGYSRFDVHAWSNFYMATFGNLLSVLGVYWSGIYGQFGFQLIPLLIFIFAAQRMTKFQIRFSWEWKEARRLIAVGFPLMIVSLAIVLSQTIDRVLILSIIGGETGLKLLGMLYISSLVVTFLMIASNSVSSVILPVFRSRIAQSSDAESLKDIIEGPVLLFAFAMSVFVALTTIWTETAVRTFLPAFVDGITPMYILAWVGFASIFEIFSAVIFSTLDRQWSLLSFQVSALGLQVVGDYFVLKSGGGLVGIALVTVSARFLMGFSSFLTSGSKPLRFRRAFEIAVLSLIPGVAAALATAIGIMYFPVGQGIVSNIFTGGIRTAILLAAWTPLLLLLKKRTSLFDVAKKGLKILKEKITLFQLRDL